MRRVDDGSLAGGTALQKLCLCGGAWLILLACVANASGQVSGWRGDGSGRWPKADPPIAWDGPTGKNIAWKTKVGKGQSTPVVVGERALLTAEPDKLLCVDCRDGKIVWQVENSSAALGLEIKRAEKAPAPGCGYGSATPVTDGKLVYVCYGTGVVACYDLEGQRQWARYLDLPLTTQYGRSASPQLAGGKLLLTVSTLLALDPETGNTVWEANKAEAAYGTPAIARIGETDMALTPAGACVRIADGTILARHLGELASGSPIVHEGAAYYVGPVTTAVKLPASGREPFEPSFLWKSDDVEGEMFASPVWHDGRIYCASNEGMLYVLNAATGKMVYAQELPLRAAGGNHGEPANIYPSLTLAGQSILACNDDGETVAFAGGNEYKQLALNRLGKGSGACPLPHGRTLLLRGGQFLFCIGTSDAP